MPVSKNVKNEKKKTTWQSVKNGEKNKRPGEGSILERKSARSAGPKCTAPASSTVEHCRPVVDLHGGLCGISRCYDRDGRPGRPDAFMRESETEHCTVGRDRPLLSQAMRGRVRLMFFESAVITQKLVCNNSNTAPFLYL